MTRSVTLQQQFAAARYRALDLHTPLSERLSMLAENRLSMRFPDGGTDDERTKNDLTELNRE